MPRPTRPILHRPRLRAQALILATLLGAVPAQAADAIATVNGRPVPRAQLDILLKEVLRQGRGASVEVSGQAREELIGREVLAQEAERTLGTSPALQAQVDFMRQQALINALREQFFLNTRPSEAELREAYAGLARRAGARELQVRHILVAQEAQAQALITQIKQGAAFEALARSQSRDTASAAAGGLLDWTPEGAFAPAFAAGLDGLAAGQAAARPVQTAAGWHVLRLEAARPAQPPTFEAVRPRLVDAAIERRWRSYVAELRAKARVQ